MAADVKNKNKQRSKALDTISVLYRRTVATLRGVAFADGEAGAEISERRYLFLCARAVLGSIFCALLSRTQLAFSIYPFGIAFLCASGHFTPIYAVAGLFSALSLGNLSAIYIVVCAFSLLFRTLVCIYTDMTGQGVKRFPVYSEPYAYRIICGCLCAFCVGLYNLFFGKFTYYSFLGSVMIMAVLPICSYIFIYALEPTEGEERREAARLFMCTLLVWSLSDVSILSIGLADAAAFALIVSEAAKGNSASAALMGLAAGLPRGVSTAVIYALSGVAGTLLCSLSHILGYIGTFTFTVMAQGYVGGYSALLSCLPGAGVGLCLMIVEYKYSVTERIGGFFFGRVSDSLPRAEVNSQETAERISDISDTFASLSEMLRSLSAYGEHSRILDVREILECSVDAVCSECPERGRCYGDGAEEMSDSMRVAAASLSRERRLRRSSAGRYFREECARVDELVFEVNRRMSEAEERTMRRGGCRLLASDYEAMSRILDSHLRQARATSVLDKELSDHLTELSHRRSYGIGSVSVWGKRRKKIYACGIDIASHTVGAGELRREFGKACHSLLSSPVYSVDGTRIELEMHSLPILAAEFAYASMPKKGERECGDSVRTLENSEGYAYSVLCDGMGSGSDAARTSGICVEYIKSMLSHANPKELTVEMLNAVLREQTGECSSTVDLFELDTYTGQGCFIKSGAAPSFVCRGRDVYKVTARTIPIGITDRIGAERIRFRLRAGDIVVMVSDGIVEGGDDARLVVESLCGRRSDDAQRIAEALLCSARERLGERDDMTVAVIAVKDRDI